MVYERIRYTDIPVDGGSAVSNADGIISPKYGGERIDGRICKIWYDQKNVANNGSIWMCVSGTDEKIWSKNDADADVTAYPRVQIVDNTSTEQDATSGNNIWTERVTRGMPLYIAGSGCGNAKTVNKIRVWYY